MPEEVGAAFLVNALSPVLCHRQLPDDNPCAVHAALAAALLLGRADNKAEAVTDSLGQALWST